MKVRILGNVKHDGVMLKEYEIYDLDEKSALALLKDGNATTKNVEQNSTAQKYVPKKVKIAPDGTHVPGEQVVDEERLAAIEGKTGKEVKGVEPASEEKVQGEDDTAAEGADANGEQEQAEKGKEEEKEDAKVEQKAA